MDQRWFEDMMSQKYHEDICFNPSKLFLMQYIVNDNVIHEKYKIKGFQEYLYRMYSDNSEIANKHPSYMIRNLEMYGVADLEEHAVDTLESWVRDSQNGILKKYDKWFVLSLDINDSDDIVKNTKRLSQMMYKKLFKGQIPTMKNLIEEIVSQDDHNLQVFGNGSYKKRVLEDMQYCPVCEEYETSNLVCVHIFEKSMGATDEELVDKSNGLILCKQHAMDFINQDFWIDKLGFIHGNSKTDIESGAHLSFIIRTKERKKYIEKRLHMTNRSEVDY